MVRLDPTSFPGAPAVLVRTGRRPRRSGRAGPPHWGRCLLLLLLGCLALALPSLPARAEIQFDVFVGFDDHVREGHWFPVAFEILNDGPSFDATVLLGPDSAPEAEPRTFALELPTGTRKRVVLPVFAPKGQFSRWEARLLDRSGKVVAERDNLAPKGVPPGRPLLGALPRTFGGLPAMPEFPDRVGEASPGVVRLQVDYLPSNPLALEALTSVYLNSEKAADLKPEQVDALLGWLHQGGHLIVGIEQANDVTALPWLRGILPFAPEAPTNLPVARELEGWLAGGKRAVQVPLPPRRTPPPNAVRRVGPNRPGRNSGTPAVEPAVSDPLDPYQGLVPDEAFAAATEVPVILGRSLGGEVLAGAGPVPLIVSAPRGRGTVTALAFSPERDPFRSWKHRPLFWARLTGVPSGMLVKGDPIRWGGLSIDGIFGAMLDSRQVRKLPVPALLALLLVYLVVIGPFDQWILKRLGKQMWTWVTFPAYVVLFSGLIYFIGYRLRAGDLEWNEIQVVDQLPRGEGAALRGRTWAALYSPANARYRFASEQPYATLRAEFSASGRVGAESSRFELRLPPRGFEAGAQVPVWINQLFVSDWLDAGPVLVSGRVTREDDGTARAEIENKSGLRFEKVVVAFAGRLHELGEIGPGQRREMALRSDDGLGLDDLLAGLPQAIQVVNQRRSAFGGEGSGIMDRNLDGVLLASFVQRHARGRTDSGESFFSPAGFDANHLVERGEAMVFAWAPQQSVAPAIQRFAPTRMRRDAVVRAVLPVLTPAKNATGRPIPAPPSAR